MNQSFFMMAVKDEINFKAILNCETSNSRFAIYGEPITNYIFYFG